jgi:hypothetical protein
VDNKLKNLRHDLLQKEYPIFIGELLEAYKILFEGDKEIEKLINWHLRIFSDMRFQIRKLYKIKDILDSRNALDNEFRDLRLFEIEKIVNEALNG